MRQTRFRDRADAGRQLVEALPEYANRPEVLVLGLPRGGVPVAYEVAKALGAELDVFLVRKLGLVGHEELAMGAIASDDIRVVNEQVTEALGVPDDIIDAVEQRERKELLRREREYRGDRPFPDVTGRTVILVDDGLATGSTMRAAARALQQRGPEKLVIAVPVAARETCNALRDQVDELVCLLTPEHFHAVGLWYDDFSQTSDEEVRDLLDRADRARSGAYRGAR